MFSSGMFLTFITVLGGLGIFLLGLIVMTGALQSLAGDTLRLAMLRITKSPYSGALSGATMTALLQSSSATTVAAVGFAGAGILTFSEALGIIFGANLGTTVKGWIVALLGFKFPLGLVVLPLIFVGVILKIFAKGNLAHTGFALAGFGLIFVGIDTLQDGVRGFEGIITPAILPDDTFIGRLQLIALGIGVTIITQSSSAGVVITLTLLFSNVINFPQAAALVIGMDIGTTVTAAMATIGGNIAAKRTGFSHVIYNLITACGAFMLITPYVMTWEYISPGALGQNSEIALVAFHTLFNFLGVILILPFTQNFANLIQKLFPEKRSIYTSELNEIYLNDPRMALNSVYQTTNKEYVAILEYLNAILAKENTIAKADIDELQKALDESHKFLDKIHLKHNNDSNWDYLVSLIHILDHLQRLHERLEEEEDRAVTAKDTKELDDLVEILRKTIEEIIAFSQKHEWDKAKHVSNFTLSVIHRRVERYRKNISHKIASGEIDVPQGSDQLEAIRWLKRVTIHINRINHHISHAMIAISK